MGFPAYTYYRRIVIGVVAVSETGPSINTVEDMQIASGCIFLVLTVVQAVQTVVLATLSISGMRNQLTIRVLCRMALTNNSSPAQSQFYNRAKDSLGIRYGNYIIREIFSIATVNTSEQVNEHLWYPLLQVALPEILVVFLYITPGLVPKREELQQHPSLRPIPHKNTSQIHSQGWHNICSTISESRDNDRLLESFPLISRRPVDLSGCSLF